jgi:lipid-A-disaccharide synthase-like uncharacterized protein
MALIIWLIVWLCCGHPTQNEFPVSAWAISLYVCAAISILIPRTSGFGWK